MVEGEDDGDDGGDDDDGDDGEDEKRRRRNPGLAKPDALSLKPGHEDNSWMQHHWAPVSPRSMHCIHKDWDLLLGNVRMDFVL